MLTFADLFAGIGGFRLSLESFGYKCVFSSEIEKHARDIYKDNFGEYPSGDICKIKASDITKLDIIVGGFPCQAMSISGKKDGFEGKTGRLFFEILKLIKFHKPKVVLLENVKNILSVKKGCVLKSIIEEFDMIGYQVYYKVLNSVNFGVPQCRERTYFVAYPKNIDIVYEFPNPVPNVFPKVSDIIDYKYDTDLSLLLDFDKYPLSLVECVEYKHKPLKIGEINKGRQGERVYSIDYPGITICTSGGGVGGSTGLYASTNCRKLGVDECRKMFGFPADFILNGNPRIIKSKFGNSVVINVINAIMESIIIAGIVS